MATEHGLPPELRISILELFKRVQPLPLMVPIWFSSSSVDNAAKTYVFLITEKKKKKEKRLWYWDDEKCLLPHRGCILFSMSEKRICKGKD